MLLSAFFTRFVENKLEGKETRHLRLDQGSMPAPRLTPGRIDLLVFLEKIRECEKGDSLSISGYPFSLNLNP